MIVGGTNENSNGLLREFYPKGRNLSHVGEKTLKKNLALINARPKKYSVTKHRQICLNRNCKKCCTWFDNSPVLFQAFFRADIYFG